MGEGLASWMATDKRRPAKTSRPISSQPSRVRRKKYGWPSPQSTGTGTGQQERSRRGTKASRVKGNQSSASKAVGKGREQVECVAILGTGGRQWKRARAAIEMGTFAVKQSRRTILRRGWLRQPLQTWIFGWTWICKWQQTGRHLEQWSLQIFPKAGGQGQSLIATG